MKYGLYIMILSGIFGIMACHGDTRYASDVNSALLTSPENSLSTMPITIQGVVSCSGCQSGDGMVVVITSALSGPVAQKVYGSVGGYSLTGSVRSGDVLEIKVSVMKSSGPVLRSAVATVAPGTNTIQQDFKF